MSDAKKFRERAEDCRSLAKNARTEADRAMLEDIADELAAEAHRIDEEEAGSSPALHVPPQGSPDTA